MVRWAFRFPGLIEATSVDEKCLAAGWCARHPVSLRWHFVDRLVVRRFGVDWDFLDCVFLEPLTGVGQLRTATSFFLVPSISAASVVMLVLTEAPLVVPNRFNILLTMKWMGLQTANLSRTFSPLCCNAFYCITVSSMKTSANFSNGSGTWGAGT